MKNENFGNQVFTLRKNLKLTQEKFGEPLGIGGGAVSLIEKGGDLRLETARKIKEVYGLSLQISNDSGETKVDVGFWKGLVDEYREREKGYRQQIEFLMSQLGKPMGDLDAVVSNKSGKCKVVRLHPRLHHVEFGT